MLIRTKLTKYVWYEAVKWKVVKLIQPNKHDDFLLLERRTNCVHEDGSPSMDMTVIDCHNDEFYPNTKKVRALMKRIQRANEDIDRAQGRFTLGSGLQSEWLKMMKDD